MRTIWPYFNIDSQAKYSWKKTHVVYLVGSAWCRVYELLKPNETITLSTGTLYRTQLMRLNRARKNHVHYSRHDKIILLHDNARPHVSMLVKTYLLETLKWKILPHSPYSPDIFLSDYHLFRSMTNGLSEQHFI